MIFAHEYSEIIGSHRNLARTRSGSTGRPEDTSIKGAPLTSSARSIGTIVFVPALGTCTWHPFLIELGEWSNKGCPVPQNKRQSRKIWFSFFVQFSDVFNCFDGFWHFGKLFHLISLIKHWDLHSVHLIDKWARIYAKHRPKQTMSFDNSYGFVNVFCIVDVSADVWFDFLAV